MLNLDAPSMDRIFINNNKYKLLMIGLLLGLVLFTGGIWQLYNYFSTQKQLKIYQARLHSLPKPFRFLTGNTKDLEFEPVVVEGDWMDTVSIFIENSIYKGKTGFEVLTPMKIKGEAKWLLVDRGWIEKEGDKILPSLPHVSGKIQLLGYIHLMDEHNWILRKNIIDSEAKPWVMKKIDIKSLHRLTKHDFYPFILRLDPSEAYGFTRDWMILETPPKQHIVHAFQWLALAILVMVGGYFIYIRE